MRLVFALEGLTVDTTVFVIDRFSGQSEDDGLPKGWNPLTFKRIKRETKYSVEHEDGNYFVKAESKRSASGIYKDVEIEDLSRLC